LPQKKVTESPTLLKVFGYVTCRKCRKATIRYDNTWEISPLRFSYPAPKSDDGESRSTF
jgi:hypothetical protein